MKPMTKVGDCFAILLSVAIIVLGVQFALVKQNIYKKTTIERQAWSANNQFRTDILALMKSCETGPEGLKTHGHTVKKFRMDACEKEIEKRLGKSIQAELRSLQEAENSVSRQVISEASYPARWFLEHPIPVMRKRIPDIFI